MEKHSETQTHILNAAQKEFSEKGFREASLRNIVKIAGVTTGAFYGYYKNKEELFEALVNGAAEGLYGWYEKLHIDYKEKSIHEQKNDMRDVTKVYVPQMVHYIYDHFKAFKLIFCCSGGTKYEKFLDSLIAIEEESCYEFLAELKEGGYEIKAELDDTLIHIISSSYFQVLHEMVAHDVPEKKAQAYMKSLGDFQYAGWFAMLGL